MKKIMIVDDEDDIRQVVRMILEKDGYEVIEASSGQQCLDLLKSGDNPDLILLDVMMPELDGWEVSKKLKENAETKDLNIAMLTVRSEDDDKIKSYGFASANWHISKPIEKTKFLKTVKFLLR